MAALPLAGGYTGPAGEDVRHSLTYLCLSVCCVVYFIPKGGGGIGLMCPSYQDSKIYEKGTGGGETEELVVCRGCSMAFKPPDGGYLSWHTYMCTFWSADDSLLINHLADLI